MTITLDEIKAAQDKLAQMIAAFETQTKLFPLTLSMPELNEGERYVGAIISADGTRKEHIILLPGEKEKSNWKDASEWAKSIGGELPDRVEGALLFATLKDEFKEEWHWTRETHAADSDYAWCQDFDDGQGCTAKDDKLRARAVRRLAI